MIQRIQSVYLLIASLLHSLLFAFPFANAEKTTEGAFMDGDLDLYDNPGLLSAALVAIAVSLISIFMYNNRKLQMKLSMGGILISLTLCGLAAYFAFGSSVAASLGIGLFLPVIAIVMYFLAYRGIKSDDDLVKSSNRLR